MMCMNLHRHDLYDPGALWQYIRALITKNFETSAVISEVYRKLCYWDLVMDLDETWSVRYQLNELANHLGVWDSTALGKLNRRYYWLLGNQEILKRNRCFYDNDIEGISRCISINFNVFPEKPHVKSGSGFDMICIGGGNEIGGSCYAYRYKDTVFFVDAGIYQDRDEQLPDFTKLPPDWVQNLKCIIITHLHSDHCGALLYYNPRINKLGNLHLNHSLEFIMSPTSVGLIPEIMKLNAINSSISEMEVDFRIETMKSTIRPVEVEFSVGDLIFTLIPVAHCPGSVIVHVKSPEGSILHAVDYSLISAFGLFETNLTCLMNHPVDSIIIEGTYGIISSDLKARNRQFRIPDIMKNFLEDLENHDSDYGARRLFPCFALGRSQELFHYINKNFQDTSRIEGAARRIAIRLDELNSVWKTRINLGKYGYRNIVASSGWLEENSTSSSILSDLDENEPIILTGYIMPGTKAWEITQNTGSDHPYVFALPFSSHASFSQLLSLIYLSQASHVVIVHRGYDNESGLKLNSFLQSRGVNVTTPANGEFIKI